MRCRKWLGGGSDPFGIRFEIVLLRAGQQPAAQAEPGSAMTVGEKAVMRDAMEAVGQRVQQEAADELVRFERHDLRLAAVAVVSPAEGDLFVVHAHQPGIGDGDAMGVAAEIGQHLPWTAEGRLGVDNPFPAASPGEQEGEGIRLCQVGEIAEEIQPSPIMGGAQFLQKELAEQTRQHAHGQEELRPAGYPARAVRRQTTARHDAMDVGMVVQVLAPTVQHCDETDLGAQVLGIEGNRAQRLGRCFEQDRVNRSLVLEGDCGDLGR